MKKLICAILVVVLLVPAMSLAEGTACTDKVVTVSTAEELLNALQDANAQQVIFESKEDIEVFGEGGQVTIDKPLEIRGSLAFVECTVDLRSTITVSGSLSLGAATLNNNGYIRVRGNALLGSYMSDLMNFGAIYIEKDGVLECDRGGGWINLGMLINEGTVTVTDDGGYAELRADSVLDNRGIIDVTSKAFRNHQATIIGDTDAVLAAVTAD